MIGGDGDGDAGDDADEKEEIRRPVRELAPGDEGAVRRRTGDVASSESVSEQGELHARDDVGAEGGLVHLSGGEGASSAGDGVVVGEGGDDAELAERKWLPGGKASDASYIAIYPPKVAMITLARPNYPVVIIIDSEAIASTQQIMFNTLWGFL